MMTVSKCSKDAGTVLHGIDWKPEGDRSIRMDLLCDREKGGTFPPLKQQGGAKEGSPASLRSPMKVIPMEQRFLWEVLPGSLGSAGVREFCTLRAQVVALSRQGQGRCNRKGQEVQNLKQGVFFYKVL